MDRWTQTLFDKITDMPLPGFRTVAIDQAINADKALWIKLAEETRGNLASTAGQPKPFDVAFERLTNLFFSTSTDAVWAWCPGHR